MIKKRFTIFMMALFIMSLPAIVHAQFANEVKLLASDGVAGDSFGKSVSISGDTVIVGVPSINTGYVFVRDPGTGVWTEQQKLTASDGNAKDSFGKSVSISGDTAIAGADMDDDNGGNSGSAYVFVRDSATGAWTEQQQLTASDGAPKDYFGNSVSISGDTAIVGAYNDGDNGYGSGSAYIFVRDPGTGVWTEQQKLLASDGYMYDSFGQSVSISGDTAVVGAFGGDDNGAQSGSAYVFVRDPATGVWTEQQKLLASDGASDDRFGNSVSISGDTAIAGVQQDDDNGNYSGSAYVFVRDPDTGAWTQQQKLLASDGAANEYFGNSVSISGDLAIVGAFRDDDNGSESGSAYVFVRDPATGAWTQQQKLLASDGAANDYFGYSVSISGNTVIAGAQQDDDNGSESGSAYLYTSSGAAAPEIDVSPLTNNFGDVVVGGSSSPQVVAIDNTGTADLNVSDISLSDSTNFSLDVNGGTSPCGMTPVTVTSGGGSCTVEVTFTPGTVGSFNATLTITSDDSDEATVNVSLSGTGVAAPAPKISVSPTNYTFNDVVVGGSSSPQVVTIDNTGTADLSVSDISLSDAANFSLNVNSDSSSCGMTTPTIAAGESCTVEVTFIPGAVGSFNAKLTITSDDVNASTVNVPLSGTGVAAPAPNISVSPSTLDSGEVVIHDSSSPVEVTLSNMGTDVLNVTDIALASGTDYSLDVHGGSNPCKGTSPVIEVDESCTVEVTFGPQSVGTLNDTLTISSDDDDEPDVDVLLTGVGLDDTIVHVTAATGTGTITIDTSGNAGTFFSGVHAYLDTDPSLNQTNKPADVEFPDGLVAFKVNGVDPGGTIDVTITFPTVFSEGATYYKVDADGFYEFQGAVINGSTVILTLTDGGPGDNDGIANGEIDDPSGVAILVADIETEAETSTDTVHRSKDNSNFFGCSIRPNNAGQGFDPVLPMLALISVVYLFNRRRRTRD